MNKTQRAFEEVKTIEDFKEELQNNIRYITGGFFDSKTAEAAIAKLDSMSKEQEKDFLSFLHHVDKTFSFYGASNGNRFHKLPTVLSGCVYYEYFPETIAPLSLDELSILAYYSTVEPLSFYEHAVERYGKELLSSIASKTTNYSYRMGFLMLADKRIKKGNNDAAIRYITDTSLDDLKNAVHRMDTESYSKAGIRL